MTVVGYILPRQRHHPSLFFRSFSGNWERSLDSLPYRQIGHPTQQQQDETSVQQPVKFRQGESQHVKLFPYLKDLAFAAKSCLVELNLYKFRDVPDVMRSHQEFHLTPTSNAGPSQVFFFNLFYAYLCRQQAHLVIYRHVQHMCRVHGSVVVDAQSVQHITQANQWDVSVLSAGYH